jgi:glycosyltransferase involved in cell wall biosynthesis
MDSATDISELSAAMNALLQDGALRQRMGHAAAELMRQHDWDSVARRTLAVYYRHLSKRVAVAAS